MAYDRQLVRGAVVNLVGLIAKLIHPLFFVIIAWLFGTEVMGLYFLAVFIVQIADSAVSAGYNDATTIYASEHVADDGGGVGARDAPDGLYQVFANAFVVTMAMSAVVMIGALWAIEPVVATWYPDKPELVEALSILAWSLPLMALPQLCVAATKALMMMEYETGIHGFAKPLLLVLTSVAAWALGGGVVGLMWAHMATQILMTLLGLWAFARHFSMARTWAAIRRFRLDTGMLKFALPQNLNMTLNRYLTRIDVIMLGFATFAISKHELAFFTAAALATMSLREFKLIFSTALGPIIARHHAHGERNAMIDALSKVSRWTTTLAVPVALAVVVLRSDILKIVDASFTGDTTFVLWLLVGPFLICAVGLAGNAVVWTRHSVWNLLNSAFVAIVNTALNYLLIPRYGLAGAAAATAMSMVLVSAVQMLELWWLEGAFIRPSAVAKPWLGLLAGLAVLGLLWDPASIDSLGIRIALAVAVVGLSFVVMAVLRHEEVMPLVHRLRRVLRLPPGRNSAVALESAPVDTDEARRADVPLG